MTTTMFRCLALALLVYWPSLTAGHAAIWHPSMWGFNVTFGTFPYDNRPVTPLYNLTFDQWWLHGHLGYPPNPGDFFELPAGKPATAEIACTKAATSYFNTSDGGNIMQGDDPCPGSPMSAYHTTGIDDVKGCALAITYKSDVTAVQPEDFSVFSVNHTCVWTRFTNFQVPARMPPCPDGGCICAFFWIHSPDSGSEQNYMNGFRCNVTDSTSNIAVAQSQLARRCGADPDSGQPEAAPGNCTYGAKQPFYWLQQERNNMFEGYYSPPFYTDLYNFEDGAQDDIFLDSYTITPSPGANSTIVPTLNNQPTRVSSSPRPSQTSSPVPPLTSPNGSTTGKPQQCVLKLQSKIKLNRRSLFKNLAFLARSKKPGHSFSLWHPF